MTNSVGWTFSQHFSSLAVPVWDWQCLENTWTKGLLNESVNEWITKLFIEQPQLHRVCSQYESIWVLLVCLIPSASLYHAFLCFFKQIWKKRKLIFLPVSVEQGYMDTLHRAKLQYWNSSILILILHNPHNMPRVFQR